MNAMLPADPAPRLAAPAPEVWSRAEAIEKLRPALLKLSGDGRSMCQVAAERGIFCGGFRRWPDREFHERWRSLIGVSTHLTRDQMEELADIWQLSEQLRHRVALACDAQTISPGACRGWDEFSNRDLELFCGEILGRLAVVSERKDQSAQTDPDPSGRAIGTLDTNPAARGTL